MWWGSPLISVLNRQRQEDLGESEDTLVSLVSVRTARHSQKQTNQNQKRSNKAMKEGKKEGMGNCDQPNDKCYA